MRFINWKRFWVTFAICYVAFLVVGCSAAWLSAVSALLPALQAAVTAAISFVIALEGKTVSAAVSQAIQKIGVDIATEITNVQTIIADAKNAADPTVIGQVQAVFQSILSNLNGILSGLSITDSATVSKLTSLIGLAVAAVTAILGLIPVVQAKLAAGLSKEELHADDELAANHVKTFEQGLKDGYHVIVTTPTANADVNSALAGLPQSL